MPSRPETRHNRAPASLHEARCSVLRCAPDLTWLHGGPLSRLLGCPLDFPSMDLHPFVVVHQCEWVHP
jgi:hypothetical protein